MLLSLSHARALDIMARWTRDVGFPIVVATVLLYALVIRLPPAVDDLASAVRENTQQTGERLATIERTQQRMLDTVGQLLKERVPR